jgi:hypothetical protein
MNIGVNARCDIPKKTFEMYVLNSCVNYASLSETMREILSQIIQKLFLSICLSVCLSVCLSIYYLSLFLSIYVWLYSPLLNLGRFFSFLIYTQSVGLLERGISPSQGRYLHTGQHKQRINAHTGQTGIHALDRAATVIGKNFLHSAKFSTD